MQMQMRCNAMPGPASVPAPISVSIDVYWVGPYKPLSANEDMLKVSVLLFIHHSARTAWYYFLAPTLLGVVTILEIPTAWGARREISEGNRYSTRTNPLEENKRKVKVKATFFFSLGAAGKFKHAGTYKDLVHVWPGRENGIRSVKT